MENFNQFADRIRLRFRCVNCGQTIEQEFNVPAPHLDRGDNSADTENTSEEHCMCSTCRHKYDIDITTNELDGMVVVSDEQDHDIETISVQSIFEEDEEDEGDRILQDVLKPSHIIRIMNDPTKSIETIYYNTYLLCKRNFANGIAPTIEFINEKAMNVESAKLLFGKLLVVDAIPMITCKNLSNDMETLQKIFDGIRAVFSECYPSGLIVPRASGITITEPQIEITGGGTWKTIALGDDVKSILLKK